MAIQIYDINTFFFREFSNERTRVERRETFRKLRMRENFSKAFEGYFQWISKAGTEVSNLSVGRTLKFQFVHLIDAQLRSNPPFTLPFTINATGMFQKDQGSFILRKTFF